MIVFLSHLKYKGWYTVKYWGPVSSYHITGLVTPTLHKLHMHVDAISTVTFIRSVTV